MPRRYNPKSNQARALSIYESRETTKQIAEKFGVTCDTVRKIKRGVFWADITGHDKHAYTPPKVKKIHTVHKKSSSCINARPGTEPWKYMNISVKEKLAMAIEELLT